MVEVSVQLPRVLESEGGGKAKTEKTNFSWHQEETAPLRKLSVCLFASCSTGLDIGYALRKSKGVSKRT